MMEPQNRQAELGLADFEIDNLVEARTGEDLRLKALDRAMAYARMKGDIASSVMTPEAVVEVAMLFEGYLASKVEVSS